MFDVGFSEILLIAVVALLVLGPERLPKAARFTGLWVRRARSQWDSVKTEFEREIAAEDLKRSIDSARRQASAVAAEMGSLFILSILRCCHNFFSLTITAHWYGLPFLEVNNWFFKKSPYCLKIALYL